MLFKQSTSTARQDSSGPHDQRYMMITVLSWQARAAGETRRMAPWKSSIHSMMSGEESCSDPHACVLDSAHSSSAAVNPLAMSRQQQATLALDISMPMTRSSGGPAWPLDQHSAGVNGHEAQQHGKRAASVWITLKQLRKIALVEEKT